MKIVKLNKDVLILIDGDSSQNLFFDDYAITESGEEISLTLRGETTGFVGGGNYIKSFNDEMKLIIGG